MALLARGVKLYEKAVEEENAAEKVLLRAIGLLRAAEHLALAGLYAARHKHRQKVRGAGQGLAGGVYGGDRWPAGAD